MIRHPRVRVIAEPHGRRALFLTFAEDCPYCDRRHQHGMSIPTTGPDGTYGPRTPHCANHTHERRADGRPAKLTKQNECPNDHPQYILVPVEVGR